MIISSYGSRTSLFNECVKVCVNAINQFPNKKVGIINWWWLTEEEANINNLKRFVESQDICFFVSEEIFNRHNSINVNDVFTMLNSHNVFYILFSEDLTLSVPPNPARSFYSPWFLKSPLYIPVEFIPDLEYRKKDFTFNLMLGSKKSFRTLIYKLVSDNRKVYSSYLGHETFKDESYTFLDDKEVTDDLTAQDVVNDKLNTMNFVNREGIDYPISHVVPQDVYANTHFDLVTETFVKNGHRFLTEKTAKPLATGRFFSWYASEGMIPYLHQYKFDFSSYPASFDYAHNDVDRLNYLIELVEEIVGNENFVKDIYQKTKENRIYNMNHYKFLREGFIKNINNWITERLVS